MKVDASGGSEVQLQGHARELALEASGGVGLDAAELVTERVVVDASGGVDARVHAKGELRGEASGGVTIRTKGRPKVAVKTSGGASVRTE